MIRTWKPGAGSGVVAVRPDSGLGAVRRAPTRRPLGVLAHLDASLRVRMAASAVAGRRSRAAQQARCIRKKACRANHRQSKPNGNAAGEGKRARGGSISGHSGIFRLVAKKTDGPGS